MKTEAVGRSAVEGYIKQASRPFIWVSVREPEEQEPNTFYEHMELSKLCKGVLTLEFSDFICDDWSEEAIAQMESKYAPKWKPFTQSMRDKLDAFITQYDGCVDVCLVNCYAGVSRSAALAAYVGRKTGEVDWFKKYYQTRGKFPCFYVCRILDLPIPEFLSYKGS